MKHYRIKFLQACVCICILLLTTTATAKSSYSKPIETIPLAQAKNQAIVSPAGVKALGFQDIPTLLRHAGIPLENLQSSNVSRSPAMPLADGDYQWHTFFGSTQSDHGYEIAVENNGGVYIIGVSSDSWNGPAG